MQHTFEIQLSSWQHGGGQTPSWRFPDEPAGTKHPCTREGRFFMTGEKTYEIAKYLDDRGLDYVAIRAMGPLLEFES